jgi:hypothetical protein
MRNRSALAGAAAVAAPACGLAATPAHADGSGEISVAPLNSGDVSAAASRHTIDEFLRYANSEASRQVLAWQTGWTLRCWGGDLFTNWKLQRWY